MQGKLSFSFFLFLITKFHGRTIICLLKTNYNVEGLFMAVFTLGDIYFCSGDILNGQHLTGCMSIAFLV